METPAYRSIRETAEIFGVSYWLIRRLILAGKIRGTRIGGVWRISQEEIERLGREGARYGDPQTLAKA